MITSRISTNTLHPRQYDCPTRTFTQIYELSYFSSVAQLCPTLWDPTDCSTPGLSIEFRARYAGVGDQGSLLPFAGTWASQVALAVKNPPANAWLKRHRFDPWAGRKSPRRRKWQPTAVFVPGESHGQRSLVGCSPWGRQVWNTTEATWHAGTI